MRHTEHPAGTVYSIEVASKALGSNRLGDPTTRRVDVYVPHGHDGKDLPLLVDLVGFTAGGPAHTNWRNFGENVPERLDRLIGDKQMPPVVVAFPDCFTRLGGNQYVNSSAVGNWEDFLISEMLPAVEGQFGCGGTGRRGVFGKSSGGHGSLVHAMLHPDVWAAARSAVSSRSSSAASVPASRSWRRTTVCSTTKILTPANCLGASSVIAASSC